jgi:hypothetical protein
MRGPVAAPVAASRSLRQRRRMTRKSQPVTLPMRTAMTMALGALTEGRGISSLRWETASNAVNPSTLWRRASMKAMPSGQPVVLVHVAKTALAGW